MILIIDDDFAVRTSLSLLLERAGYSTQSIASPEEALALVRHSRPALILLDMNFSLSISGTEGLELLSKIRIFQPDVPVILITAWGSIQLAVEGMKAGAANFVTKPWNNIQLLEIIKTTLQLTNQKEQGTAGLSRAEIDRNHDFEMITGNSPQLVNILNLVTRVAPTNASVLITGESGTGKELIAHAIHTHSKRKNQAFIKVNLGGMSQSLFESEMFGHKKGAFTDAVSDRTGRFELADKGTIFLDEIGDLDLSSQVKLLRVLQDQTFEPLGESKSRTVDVRVICATNKNLRNLIECGQFREDLFYRINLISIHIPPLRERTADIGPLVQIFTTQMVQNTGINPVKIEKETIEWLEKQDFPGNVRELRNLVERTVILAGKEILTIEDFLMNSEIQKLNSVEDARLMSLDETEKEMILKTLKTYPNNLAKVARVLGISRGALYRRLEKYNIPHEPKD